MKTLIHSFLSLSALLLATECLITEKKEAKADAGGGHSHDHGMGDMM